MNNQEIQTSADRFRKFISNAQQFEQFRKILSDPARKRIISVKLNQLSLWLGRLVIAFNNLEHALAFEVGFELCETFGREEPSTRSPDVVSREALQVERVNGTEIHNMIMASMSFGQKLDFLAALSLKRFSGNTRQQKHIHLIVKAISEAESFRNRMLHSVWTENFSDFSQVKTKTRGRKGLKIQRANINIPLIRQAIKAINTLETLGLFAMTHDAIVDKTDEQLFQMSEIFCPPNKKCSISSVKSVANTYES
jgi:hypothetical protein